MSNSKANEILARWNFTPNMLQFMRFPFPDSEIITRNYSQAWQDLFVISMLQGKKNGTYLEVGAHSPVENNNTYLLKNDFNWSGTSIELDFSHFPSWNQIRPECQLIISDATTIDYSNALPIWFDTEVRRIDYLQIDIDPSSNTLSVLKRLPLNDWRFSVITFETDAYTLDLRARDESRVILESHGYTRVGTDISVLFPPISPNPIPFEDWWVDPEAISKDIIDGAISVKSNMPQDLIFNLNTAA